MSIDPYGKSIVVKIHEIFEDGLPDMDIMSGRVAFIFNGCVVSGWPLADGKWEANSDVGHMVEFVGVTHWIEFPVAVWDMED